MTQLSIIIPAFNEEEGIGNVIRHLQTELQGKFELEILVIDDGSTDKTQEIARQAGAQVLVNPVNMGYGFSLKRGFQAATNECVVIIDADDTYPIHKIPDMVREYDRGVDMVVGARQGKEYIPSFVKKIARACFKWMSEFVVGKKIPDINSGFRVIRRSKVVPVLPDLSNAFSFTTSVTLVFFLQHFFVHYIPITYEARKGKSKVKYFRDALRTLQIMVDIIARYNPIKLFLMISLFPFALFALFSFLGIFTHETWMLFMALPPLFFGILILSLGFIASIFRKR